MGGADLLNSCESVGLRHWQSSLHRHTKQDICVISKGISFILKVIKGCINHLRSSTFLESLPNTVISYKKQNLCTGETERTVRSRRKCSSLLSYTIFETHSNIRRWDTISLLNHTAPIDGVLTFMIRLFYPNVCSK